MVARVIVIGADLAGPSNSLDSAIMIFEGDAVQLQLLQHRPTFDDSSFLDILQSYRQHSECIIGLDAPLSYHPGGGDRPADRSLRRLLVERGLKTGTVMPPTMNRMVYLTLRGVGLARLALSVNPLFKVVEVHPAGAMVLHGASVDAVRGLKSSQESRDLLQSWLAEQGLAGLQDLEPLRDHDIASAAAALAAWHWHTGRSAWLHLADPPFHPFGFAC